MMFNQLIIGSVIIVLTVIIQVVFFNMAIAKLTNLKDWLSQSASFIKTSIATIAVVLWLLAGITISIWTWALLFVLTGSIGTLEEAVYFATVTFTTLGYGDITLDINWRILSSLAAVNGLIIFGLTTAFLIQFVDKVKDLHLKTD